MRTAATLLAFATALLAAGCGSKSKFYPVTGKVTYQNRPAAGALVVFHPKGDNSHQAIRPSAIVRDDGTYALSSGPGEEGKGAAPGEYEVAVIWEAPTKGAAGGMGGDERREEKDVLGGRYKNPSASGLKATVGAGPTEVPAFELK